MRTTTSSNISKNIIWVNCSNEKASVEAVQIFDNLLAMGYDNGHCIEEHKEGFSICVCNFRTIKDMREDFNDAKYDSRNEVAKQSQIDKAAELFCDSRNYN